MIFCSEFYVREKSEKRNMSKVTKRKHVMKEMQNDDFDPPAESQQIVRIIGARGNNLHEVESSSMESAEIFLVTMPTKFRKNVWVKRGDFVVVEPIEEGDKVKAEIVRILTPQHIKEFTKDGIWPEKFAKNRDENKADDNDIFRNTNRNHQSVDEEESEDSSDEDDDDDEEDNEREE